MKNHSLLTQIFLISRVSVIVIGFLIILPVSAFGGGLSLTGGYAGTIKAFDGDLTAGSGSSLTMDQLDNVNSTVQEGT